jgi:hypothetical protein
MYQEAGCPRDVTGMSSGWGGWHWTAARMMSIGVSPAPLPAVLAPGISVPERSRQQDHLPIVTSNERQLQKIEKLNLSYLPERISQPYTENRVGLRLYM